MQKNKAGFHVASLVRTRIVRWVLVGKEQGKDQAGRLSVDGVIILKWK